MGKFVYRFRKNIREEAGMKTLYLRNLEIFKEELGALIRSFLGSRAEPVTLKRVSLQIQDLFRDSRFEASERVSVKADITKSTASYPEIISGEQLWKIIEARITFSTSIELFGEDGRKIEVIRAKEDFEFEVSGELVL